MVFYKYQGAGNDFLIADNRSGAVRECGGVLCEYDGNDLLWSRSIEEICDRRYGIGADGLMLLEQGQGCDFRMVYFNSDGSGGMMCGNGGRCIVAFASDLGIGHFDFEAADGLHSAEIVSVDGSCKTVRLKMKDVEAYRRYEALQGVIVPSDGIFMDTGTRHYVRMVEGIDSYPVYQEGRMIRFCAKDFLQGGGVNVNYVQARGAVLYVRTYEKGVEDETHACGTGIVASSVSAYLNGVAPSETDPATSRCHYDVQAKRDRLSVDFIPGFPDSQMVASDVWLTGPATYVGQICL